MADKNITLRQKNSSGDYDKLYTKTIATQSKLTTTTAALFGDDVSDADAALSKIASVIQGIGSVQVKVVDASGNAIRGAQVVGLYGNPYTDSSGSAGGVLQTNPLSVKSPYVDLQDQSVDVSSYVGSFDVCNVTLPIVGENNIKRFTSSQSVKFSKMITTVDVCCVGGGGGGSGGHGHYAATSSYSAKSFVGNGGGGGNIVNAYALDVSFDIFYDINIGAGGIGSNTYTYHSSYAGENKALAGGQGGNTTFMSITAIGGGGATDTGDIGTSTNGGDGGSGDATGTEFDDGLTYYSGGGANGSNKGKALNGGLPYGGVSGYIYGTYYGVAGGDGSSSGGGGGGGAANTSASSGDVLKYMSKGGNGASGLVAIRFHY